MSCSKSSEGSETKIPSKMSRFAIVPILRGKTNSAVSDRIVSALRNSSFCSSNPITKKLLIQNVHIWCIVIETSGTQSIKVICASVPYLLKLLSRANPKLKQILEDEKVASYLKFFQETDMESVLASLCTATVIIQKGIQMCQPTLCVQLSRDALMFGSTTLKTFLNALYNGLTSAFQFLWEDLGPAFHSFCSRNRVFVKYLATNLPVYALATAKSLVLFSFFVRRILQVILKLLKRFVIFMCRELKESSVDIALVETFRSFKMALKHIANFVMSKKAYEYCKCVCMSSGKWCLDCLKRIIPLLWQEILYFKDNILPFVKNFIRLAIQSSSTAARLLEENVAWFFKMCYNSKPFLQNCFLVAQPHLLKFSQGFISLITYFMRLGQLTVPYIQKLTKYFLKTAIRSCKNLIEITKLMSNFIYNVPNKFPQMYPNLKYLLINFVEIVGQIAKYLVRFFTQLHIYVLHISVNFYQNVLPLFLPVSNEIQSIICNSSNEVVTKSYSGFKIVVPSLWQAIRTASSPTFYATYEVYNTSMKAVCIMYPSLVKTIVTIQPDVFKAVVVVLKESNKAILEVSAVSYSASSQLLVAAKSFSKEVPLAFCAINQVAVGTSDALIKVSSSSIKAHDRVLKDFKKGVHIVKSSFKSAELEFVAVIDEVAIEINDVISDSPDLLALVKEGLILNSYLKERVINMLDIINIYVSKKFKIGCLIFKDFCYILINYISTFLTNYLLGTSDAYPVFILVILYFSKIIYTNLHEILSLKDCISLSSIFHKLSEIVSVNFRKMLIHTKKFTNVVISEFLHNIIPKIWNSFKCIVSSLWEMFCNFANNGWFKLEKLSAKAWNFIYENFPELWDCFKTINESIWNKSCDFGPHIWECTLKISPVMWSYNCYLAKSVWKLYVETFSQTWNHAVPLSSNYWSYTLDTCPKVWLTISENSKTNWELICFAAENSWESVTVTSFISWSLLNKIVSKSWHWGIRQVTTSVCCRTSTILVNSIKISYRICAKTGKVMYFLFDELSGVNYPMMRFEEDATTSDKQSQFRLSKSSSNSKRILLRNSIKSLSKITMQMSEIYSDYLRLDKMVDNVCTISKLSFLPVSCSYTLGQDLVKKYYSVLTSYKNVYFPTTEMFPVFSTFNIQ